MMRKPYPSLAALLLVAALAFGVAPAGVVADTETDFRIAVGPPIADLIAAAPDESAHPAADALVLYEQVVCLLDAEDRVVRQVRRVTKVFDEWAVRGLGDVRIQWDGERQEARVPVCRTFMRDGTEVLSPARAFNEVTPDGVAQCAEHVSMREMVISHVGIERGAVLELIYEIRDLEPAPLGPGGVFYLQDGLPALAREIQIESQGERPLPHASLNGAPELLSGTQVETWLPKGGGAQESKVVGTQLILQLRQGAPALPSEGGYVKAEQVPAVAFSVHGSWEELGRTLAAASGLDAAPAPELGEWLREEMAAAHGAATGETAGAETPAALRAVETVAEFVGDRLRHAAAPDRWLRAPRPPQEVLRGGCGTDWERMVLAHALLRAAGLQPEFVAPCLAAEWPEGVAVADLLGSPRVRVEAAGRVRWLSPDSSHPQAAPADLAGLPLLVLADVGEEGAEFETYASLEPAPEPIEATSTLAAKLRPAPEGEDGMWEIELDYAAAGACRRPDDESDAAKLAEQLAQGVLEDAEVTASTLLEKSPDRLHLRATVRGKLAGESDGLAVLPLPQGPRGVLDLLPAGAKLSDPTRGLGLRVRQPVRQELELVVELPQGAAVDPLPAARDLTLAGARFRQQATLEDGGVRLVRSLRLTPGEITPAEWPDLRRLLVESSRLDASRLIVRLP